MLEINLKFNGYYIFSGDMEDPFSYVNAVCEKLSAFSISESMGIDISFLSKIHKDELIKDISSRDYKVFVVFECEDNFMVNDDGQPVEALGVEAVSGHVGDHFFRTAVIFEILGYTELSHAMKMEFYACLVSDIIRDRISEKLEKEVISQVNRVNASKPRNKYYSEVMTVIGLTWDKYPHASKTAILDALSAHYYKKVSRNSLDNWISQSGLRPPKPKKYSSFELVFPQ